MQSDMQWRKWKEVETFDVARGKHEENWNDIFHSNKAKDFPFLFDRREKEGKGMITNISWTRLRLFSNDNNGRLLIAGVKNTSDRKSPTRID